MFKRGFGNKGFSLVELMVVVAIIGILAAIAIPSVGKYMAKARQTEAKTNLSSVYTAEKAFFAEYNSYSARFESIGYSPEGQLRYNVGFTAAFDPPPGTGYIVPAGAAADFAVLGYCGAGGAIVNKCTTLLGATGLAPTAIAAAACTAPVNTSAHGATCTVLQGTFRVGANAVIVSTAPAVEDRWTIDDLKILRNSESGI